MGQRFLDIDGDKIDEDSVLIKKACSLPQELKYLSPIAMEKGYSERYIKKPHATELREKIMASFKKVSHGKDLVIIEGTGHGGVGSVFDFSNADMANLLGAKVLLIAEGGIGRTIDRVTLERALYDQTGVGICGVIVNKVFPDQLKRIKGILPRGLKHKGIKEFGIMPYKPVLASPSLDQINDALGSKIVNVGHGLHELVENFVVGAMAAHNALNFFKRNVVLITPGDRDDILLAAMSKFFLKRQAKLKTLTGIVITGNIMPQKTILDMANKMGVPMILSKHDTFTTAKTIQKLIVKIVPEDKIKISETVKMIKKHIDVNGLLKVL